MHRIMASKISAMLTKFLIHGLPNCECFSISSSSISEHANFSSSFALVHANDSSGSTPMYAFLRLVQNLSA